MVPGFNISNRVSQKWKEGKQTIYNVSGLPYATGAYKRSLREGIWITYDDKGVIEKKSKYKKGIDLDAKDTAPAPKPIPNQKDPAMPGE